MNNKISGNQNSSAHLAGFGDLGLIEALLKNLKFSGYKSPTPIQAKAIPHVLEGKDLLGCAQTGTGKTAAFALPILQRIMGKPRRKGRATIQALVLAPTRELAAQIGASFATYAGPGGPSQTVVFGGVNKFHQIKALRRGVDVLVATPGRLLDLMNDGIIKLNHVDTFVLDEADRMLDMGFIHDVNRITRAVPKSRQTLMFSATMPREIQSLADSLLNHPVRVAVDPVASTRKPTEQWVYFVGKSQKASLLLKLLEGVGIDRALIFTRTKQGANRLAQKLVQSNFQSAAIHSNKSQSARERTLKDFKEGKIRIVVATDIAARGIDIKDLSHVINFDIPNEPESYVHRIGRTGRAGASGIALSFCSGDERGFLKDIERLIHRQLQVAENPKGITAGTMERSGPQRRGGSGASRPRQQGGKSGASRSARPRQQGGKSRTSRPARPPQQGDKSRTPMSSESTGRGNKSRYSKPSGSSRQSGRQQGTAKSSDSKTRSRPWTGSQTGPKGVSRSSNQKGSSNKKVGTPKGRSRPPKKHRQSKTQSA